MKEIVLMIAQTFFKVHEYSLFITRFLLKRILQRFNFKNLYIAQIFKYLCITVEYKELI